MHAAYLQNPNALGLRHLWKILTCARPECSIHTTCTFFADPAIYIYIYIYMNLNTCIHGAHLRGPLTRPDHRAYLLDQSVDVRSPERWSNTIYN